MTSFLIATSRIKDPQKYAEYAAKSGPTFAPFNGKLVIKGKFAGNLVASSANDTVAVISFPDRKSLDAWYNSPAYQAIIPLRDQALDMVATIYEDAS